jgi:hypothetical protein
MGGARGSYWWTGEVYRGFFWKYLKEGDYLEDIGVDGLIILRSIFKRWDWESWTGLLWLITRAIGRLL